MERVIIFIAPIIAFLTVLFVIPLWIKKTRKLGMLWEDMNKPGHPKNVASSGGIIVILGFVIGVLFYIGLKSFLLGAIDGKIINILAVLNVILIFGLIGIVDDLLGWRHGGLTRKTRLILAFAASVPLIVINVGVSEMSFPFFESIDFGIIYPLVFVPLGIIACSTTYNFLAGFNGLEASQGILVLGFLSYLSYVLGEGYIAAIGMIMVFSLLGFYLFNRYPAKVFPGDSLTLSIGALIAIMAILGNFEKIALIVFIPYIIEMVLKSRGKLKKHSFANPQEDGSLELKYEKIYGLTHFAVYMLKKIKPSKKVYEKEVVLFINTIQLIFIAIAYIIYI